MQSNDLVPISEKINYVNWNNLEFKKIKKWLKKNPYVHGNTNKKEVEIYEMNEISDDEFKMFFFKFQYKNVVRKEKMRIFFKFTFEEYLTKKKLLKVQFYIKPKTW